MGELSEARGHEAPPPEQSDRSLREPAAAVKAPVKYTVVDYTFQFVTITAGVLIALLINGLVEWNNNRQLVQEARATLQRELADNKRDIDATLSGLQDDVRKFDSAIKFASDMLTQKKTSINELNFHLNLADLSSANWRTAERTGALSHMDYTEVQRYSKVYDLQDLIVAQQRNLVSQLSSVTAILNPDFDPDNPNRKDLELFRERLLALRAALLVHEQMAKRLTESYAEALEQ